MKSVRQILIFLCIALGGFVVENSSVAMAGSDEGARRQSAMLGAVRVPFIRNEGQIADSSVKYYARTFGGTVYALEGGRIVYSLPRSGVQATGPRSVVLQESLQGSFAAEPFGVEKSLVAVNSFIGNRPEKWKTNLPAFDRLDFGEIYDGISLLLCAHGNNVEKVFVLSPGADPRQIAFGFEGAGDIEITADGELELQTALGPVHFTRPVAWQIDAPVHASSFTVQGSREEFKDAAGPACPSSAREARALPSTFELNVESPTLSVESFPIQIGPDSIPVEVSYALDEDGTVHFELSSYDPNKVLIIDPLLASTFIGGGGADAVQAMVVDSQTNVYVAGYTDSDNFPVTNSPYSSARAGGQDVFVSKFNSVLGTLIASTYMGGNSNDQATALGIDASSQIWLAGYTESTNFPTSSPMSGSGTNSGLSDAFVAILSNGLGGIVQATYLGGSSNDYAAAMSVSMSGGGSYIVGYTESQNFPVTNATGYATNYNGARDGFVVLFDTTLDRANFRGIFLGGTNVDQAAAVVVAPGVLPTNYIYVAGSASSTGFPAAGTGYQTTNAGSYDAFVCRLSSMLTNLPYSTFLGGTGIDEAYAVGLDISNRVYLAGYTRSEDFPRNPSDNNIYLSGYTNRYWAGQDIFVSCLTNNLTNLYASTYIGGRADDVARALVVDSSTNRTYIYLAGYTTSSNFPATRNAYDASFNGGEDAFVLRLDSVLTNLAASTYLGGGANDRAFALALASASNELVVAGITASSDFPASDLAYENVYRGGASDGFVTKFPAALAYGTLKWKVQVTDVESCSSPALTWDGMLAVGVYSGLYAFTRSGVEHWRVITTSTVASLDPLGLGAPAVGTNNFVYINTRTGKVYAVSSADGTASTIFNGGAAGSWSSIAINDEGGLYVSQDQDFYALRQNGSVQWTNHLATGSDSSPAIGSNGIIHAVATVNPAQLYAFTSASITNHKWSAVGNMYASPALMGTNIYAASSNRLYAFNSDGSTGRIWMTSGMIDSSPAVDTNGMIYIGAGNSLYAFNPDGTTNRVWRAGGDVKSSPAIAADGSIIIGATNGLYSFNSVDGTTNWFFESDIEIYYQAPLIDSEGIIYFSDDIYLYAIYGSQPPAEGGWPMFRHDALRTGNQGMNPSALLRPTGLSVSKGEYASYVHVGWNATANALSYEVWRSPTNSTATATRIKRLAQTNYNDSSLEPGKIYYYWLKAKTPIALSVFSEVDSGGIPPFPPTNVAASDGMPTNYVHVTWQFSTNASLYYVFRSLTDNTNTAEYIGSSADTNYADYTVAPGLPYYYWVKAGNDVAGISLFSASDRGGIPPLFPSGFSASQGSYEHMVALSWNSSTGASAYVLYRNTEDNSGAAVIITNISGSPMSDYAVTPLRHYYYWIRATNEFGVGGYSASVSGWGSLAPPSSVQASAGTYSNMIRVSWVAGSTDATAHVIFRGASSDPSTATWQSEVVYSDLTATNFDDTAITRGNTYYYWVAARNYYGTSTWTAANSPGGTAPSTPGDLSASDGSYTTMVAVTWSSSAGATYYTVYRHETFDSSYATQIGTASTNYLADSSAIHGMIYYYWVKAGNSFGLSSFSAFNAGWRGMAPPDSVSASRGVSTNDLNVSWSTASDATAYELWRATGSDVSLASRLANNLTAVSYNDRSSVPGTVYYYWVKSKRGTFVSAFSGYDYGYKAIGLLDLSVSDFVFLPTALKRLATPSAVSFNVVNGGSAAMLEPNSWVRYDLYLSENAVYGDGDDYWIGGSSSNLPLSARASTRVVCSAAVRSSISIPDWAAGRYYVFVFINHCLPSTWLDPNLANNVARRTGDAISITPATAIQPVWSDYDGDGKTDFAVYYETSGAWKIWLSSLGYTRVDLTNLGETGSRPFPRDYDGDGKVDPGVYHEASGAWRVALSASAYQTVLATGLGGAGQHAVPADYDGDGKVDPAVYQESTGTWRVWLSGSSYVETDAGGWGGAGQRAVPADYDGDGKTDPAVYQESIGTWRVWLSGSSYTECAAGGWGGVGQHAVPADYDGDGKIDPAVYQESAGSWRVWASSGSYSETYVTGWGSSGQTAVPGDYDGDGRVDAVVYWDTMGIWRLWLSSYLYSEMDVLISGGEGFHAITEEE